MKDIKFRAFHNTTSKKMNDKEYYLINKSQFQTRKAIEKCKTKDEFEYWIKSLEQVKE